MSFNYNKHKSNESGDSFWTSYSDLFLGMSVVFLLLYVTASLRTGTNGIQQQVENKKLSMQVQDLQNQLKMYDSTRKEYLNTQASESEEKMYNELMDKLTLLKEEANEEKNKLRQAAHENEQKEQALNQYQQLVRNIINANVMSKTKIKKREDVIEDQDVQIDDQQQEIASLEKDIQNKEQVIAENNKKINQAEKELENKLAQLKQIHKQKKMSDAAYAKQVQALKAENERKIEQLEQNTVIVQNQLAQVQGKLGQVTGELNLTKDALTAKTGENENLKNQLSQAEMEYNSRVGQLQKGFAEQTQRERAKFEAALNQEKLSAQERAKREAGYRAQLAAREKALGDKISELGQEIAKRDKDFGEKLAAKDRDYGQKLAAKDKEYGGKINELGGKLNQMGGKLNELGGRLKDTEGLLAKAKAEADARRSIAKEIREGFKKAGVQADINDQTGEVVINFGDVYFDNDSAKLKDQMKDVLKKAMPVYSRSLLGNSKVADKIASVEIIGFASPTYQGKYIDPTKMSGQNKKAIDYNLDLSYNRARAIFQYVFDENRIQFEHQKDLLPLIKVTGRSFLAEKLPSVRNPSSNDFCATHDCKKAQRVIIKFSFEDKK